MAGKEVDTNEVPESLFIDSVLQRYNWTVDEFNDQFTKHPEFFGELIVIMSTEGELNQAQRKQSERAGRDAEMDARRRRLGVK